DSLASCRMSFLSSSVHSSERHWVRASIVALTRCRHWIRCSGEAIGDPPCWKSVGSAGCGSRSGFHHPASPTTHEHVFDNYFIERKGSLSIQFFVDCWMIRKSASVKMQGSKG